MAIIGTLPNNILAGQPVSAAPVMADFNWIVSQVNLNALQNSGSSTNGFFPTWNGTSGNLLNGGVAGPSSGTLLGSVTAPAANPATGTPSSSTWLRGDGSWTALPAQVYPGAGIANSTGSAWGTSYSTSGSGTVVALTNSPTFVTPALGTPGSGTLTNCAGLPVSTGISGLGTGVATALGAAVTGSGSIVLATSPTLITPVLGTPASGNLSNCTSYPTATTGLLGIVKPDGTTITIAAGVLTASGGSATTVTVGTTTVTSGTNGSVLYDNAGVLGNLAPTAITFNAGNLSLGGNLTTSGAFASTFTMSGAFTYTFPGATSTLAALSVAQTWTAKQTFSGSTSVEAAAFTNGTELADLVAAAPAATANLYYASGALEYHTVNAANNFIANLAWSAGTTLNTATAVADSNTFTMLVKNGATAYYCTSVQVDGTTTGVTTRWQGGTAPSAGDASSVDAYVFTVIKTAGGGSPTYDVFASVTKFA